jgi:Glycosyl transferase family group 2
MCPLFADPGVGFVQAPQDYRDWSQDPFYRRLYYSYQYFFAVTQPSRNEHDGAIFAGTMGLIRRSALEQLGGWDEWCITEDAELSLRLLRAGWSGLHIDESYGYGVMPLTFEALKSQRYRWCFGGIQLFRMHWRSLFSRSSAGRLSAAQRWAYLCGAIQWYGDLMGVVFYVLMLGGAINLATGGGQLFRKMTVSLVAAIAILVALGLVRALSLMRRGTGASLRDALGAFFIWQSTGLTVARASVQGLFARKAAFLRTPKVAERASVWRVFAANWAETALGVLGVAAIVASLTRVDTASGPLLAVLLLVPTIGFLAAPANSLAAQRAALPPELRTRRQSEWRRDGRALVGGATAVAGAGAVVAAVVALFALLVAPSPHFNPPHLTEPARPHPATTPAPSPSGGASPSSQPSQAPSSTPSPSASAPTGAPSPSNTPTSAPSSAPAQPSPSGS